MISLSEPELKLNVKVKSSGTKNLTFNLKFGSESKIIRN
jgi:hypothetical protein